MYSLGHALAEARIREQRRAYENAVLRRGMPWRGFATTSTSARNRRRFRLPDHRR